MLSSWDSSTGTCARSRAHTHVQTTSSQPRRPGQLLLSLISETPYPHPNLSSYLDGEMHSEYTLSLCLFELCSNVPAQVLFLKKEGSFLVGPRVPRCRRGPGESP